MKDILFLKKKLNFNWGRPGSPSSGLCPGASLLPVQDSEGDKGLLWPSRCASDFRAHRACRSDDDTPRRAVRQPRTLACEFLQAPAPATRHHISEGTCTADEVCASGSGAPWQSINSMTPHVLGHLHNWRHLDATNFRPTAACAWVMGPMAKHQQPWPLAQEGTFWMRLTYVPPQRASASWVPWQAPTA